MSDVICTHVDALFDKDVFESPENAGLRTSAALA
jgi:hypothetical protein